MSRLQKKAAIGLSINTLVVVLISIVILTSGVAFLYQLIENAKSFEATLDERTDNELERLLVDQGKRVALPFKESTILKGENHVFGLGISNILTDIDRFYIETDATTITDESGNDIKSEYELQAETWPVYIKDWKIKEGEHKKISIMVVVPPEAVKGKYIFSVRIYTSADYEPSTQYGNTQKMIVNVK